MTKINYYFTSIYILLFFLYYFFRTDFYYIQNFLIFIFIILVFLTFLEKKIIISFKNFLDFNKKEKKYLVSFLLLAVIYFINTDSQIQDVLLNKKFCKGVNSFLFINKFKQTICLNLMPMIIVSSIIFFIFLRKIFHLLDVGKIFINTSLFFSAISIIHICTYFYLNQKLDGTSDLLAFYTTYAHGNNYAFFQLLPFYSSGFRNIEVFTILPGYVCSLFITIKSLTSKKNNNFILNFLLFVVCFLSYSRAAWVCIFLVNLYIFLLYYKDNFKILSIFYLKKLFFLTFLIIIINFVLNSLISSDERKVLNLNYYTLAKISTLFSNDLFNYFNYKNKNAWQYYNTNEASYNKFFKNNNIIDIDDKKNNFSNDKYFFDTYVQKYIEGHYNSNTNRLEIYKQSINLFLEKPLFGHGISNFKFKISSVTKSNSDDPKNQFYKNTIYSQGNAESQINQIILEKGMIGLLIFIIIFVNTFRFDKLFTLGNLLLLTVTFYSIFVTMQWYYYFWIILVCSFNCNHRNTT